MRRTKLLIFYASFFCSTLWASVQSAPNQIMVLSLSSDGNYAISTNTNQQAILWDIKNHKYNVIAKNVNIYSAYFVKNTNDFIYQDNATNNVIVKNTNGQVIKQFNPGFPTYGEVMTSDLNIWFGSDQQYQLFKIVKGKKQQFFYYWDGPNFVHETPPPKGMPYDGMDFEGSGKLFNLTLSADDKALLSSGDGKFYIWNVANPVKFTYIAENEGATTAIFSPDDKYIVSSDDEPWIYYYNLENKNGIKSVLWTSSSPEVIKYTAVDGNVLGGNLNLKYIDNNATLAFGSGAPDNFNYAMLISPQDAICADHRDVHGFKCKIYPEKYLPLIPSPSTNFNYQKTWPMLSDYSRNEAIDTSPSAHILAIAMNDENGILVYKYDPTTQTLKQIWAPIAKSSWL